MDLEPSRHNNSSDRMSFTLRASMHYQHHCIHPFRLGLWPTCVWNKLTRIQPSPPLPTLSPTPGIKWHSWVPQKFLHRRSPQNSGDFFPRPPHPAPLSPASQTPQPTLWDLLTLRCLGLLASPAIRKFWRGDTAKCSDHFRGAWHRLTILPFLQIQASICKNRRPRLLKCPAHLCTGTQQGAHSFSPRRLL